MRYSDSYWLYTEVKVSMAFVTPSNTVGKFHGNRTEVFNWVLS